MRSAHRDQGEAEQGREDDPHLGREVTLLDGVADEEDGRECQGDGAEPEKCARARVAVPSRPSPARQSDLWAVPAKPARMPAAPRR